jgi:putative nucleotidyltransferase with HDIG domain
MDRVLTPKKRILIVEDEALILSSLTKVMVTAGFEVVGVGNGDQARIMLGLEPFELILSDIKMPGTNGIELLHFVNKNYGTPMVLMTGFSEIAEASDALELGADGFLTKPFRKDELLNLIKSVFLKHNPEAVEEKENLDDNYCPIPLEDFVSGNEMNFSIYIRVSSYRYVKVAHAGEKIDVVKIAEYRSKRILNLYIEKIDFAKYLGFNLTLAKAVAKTSKIGKQEKVRYLVSTSKNVVHSLFTQEMKAESFGASLSMVETSIGVLGEQPQMLALLMNLQKHSDFIYAHSLGVSLFSTLIAKEVGWHSAKIQVKVAMCGLLHDIGEKEIAIEILNKSRLDMDAKEISMLETHSSRGLELLSQIPGVPQEILQVVIQHHEDCNGHGYPAHLKRNQISPLGRLVAVADTFCKIAIKNPDSPGHPLHESFEKMNSLFSKKLDPEFLKGLGKAIGKTPKD